MLVLDLFCGTKSVKNITDKFKWDYIGLDIEKKFNPDILIDFLKWDYKKYDKKSKPYCHNCNIKKCMGDDCYTCCDKQKSRKKYPNLKSPDYMFSNDYSKRK